MSVLYPAFAIVLCLTIGIGLKAALVFHYHQETADGFISLNTDFLLAAIALAIVLSLLLAITFVRTKPSADENNAANVAVRSDSMVFSGLQKLSLAGGDVLMLLLSFGIFGGSSAPTPKDVVSLETIYLAFAAIALGWFWVPLEHYSRRRPAWDELREIFRVLFTILLLSSTAIVLSKIDVSRLSHVIAWGMSCLLIPLGRAQIRNILDSLRIWKIPAFVIGDGENAREAFQAISSERWMGYQILGFLTTGNNGRTEITPSSEGQNFPPVLPMPVSLAAFVEQFDDPVLIVAPDDLSTTENQRLLHEISKTKCTVHVIPALRGLPLFGMQASHFFSHEVLCLTICHNLTRRSYRWIKRVFDIVAAILLLIALSPLMIYVAWRVWREDGNPVIFRQLRVGKNGKKFHCLKFRTMVRDADYILSAWRKADAPQWREYQESNFKLKQDPRILTAASWIRSFSIDELPQLINVLRGEMSLVGPRPLLPRELDEYGDSIYFYMQATPGITGLWQVSGRSGTKFNDRAMLDEWYVRNWSLWYDIALLFKTVRVVFHRTGAY